jgi:glucose/mannose-6-phosphate isomerase
MTRPSLAEADVRAADPSGMAAHVAEWPEQIRRQREALRRNPWPTDLARPSLFAVGGMGGSAMAAELLRSLVEPRLPYPFLVVRDYRLPACVSNGARLVLSSYSGGTEETLALHDEAKRRGVACAGIASGGELARRLEAENSPWRALPAGLPPRAALGYSFVSLALFLEALGDEGEGEDAWSETLDALESVNRRASPAVPESDNPAKLLARSLAGKAVCVYAGAGLPAAAARRWKGQINENAKSLAFEQALPEMNHIEIVGWQALRELHPRFAAVFLRDEGEHPRVSRRMEITRELVSAEGAETHVVRSTGTSPLARLLSLVHLGDWMSLYLAVLAGEDPTPIAKIDRLKSAL